MDFGEWLLGEIEKSGLSYSEIGRRSGFSHARISQIVNGDKPSADFCIAISRALNLSPMLVLRRAGLIPQKSAGDEELEEFLFYYDNLPAELRRNLRLTAKALVRELRDEYRTDEDEDLAPGPSPA